MNKLFLFFLVIMIILTGCSSEETDSPIYSGKNLDIGVVGKNPNVREDNVKFKSITLDELETNTEKISTEFDAVFIMKEHLSQAAESKYANVYKILSIPTFFIESSKGYLPFVYEDITYENAPEINSQTYASGYLHDGEIYKSWDYGLYNDTFNETNIKDVYTRIFTTIDTVGK
ncbi:hypothetical protein [Bacillus sp. CECT 9360]|uniref:hypothetical protein n=1 Tax=Bacillus sp. CECT 9360 TaxID=2845821 RepID=UPI001E5127AE|nr:hypothetical protein [Bacillus sp. CECT 9360]CAH0344820.1 hypothetical protein BCI9360_01088 [Bacillus sp. CECT 9360]